MLTVVHQTRKQKIKMYRKLKKKKLAEMLVNCNEIIAARGLGITYRDLPGNHGASEFTIPYQPDPTKPPFTLTYGATSQQGHRA